MPPSSASADAVKTSSWSAIGVASLNVSSHAVDVAEVVPAHVLELLGFEAAVVLE